MACARFHVSGHVQGVSFRAGTRAQALRLRLRGHARNLRDGRVEVLAEGSEEALQQLEQWLRQGPIGARVDEVVREDLEEQALQGFYTR
ncbi:acylphosphatase [Dokdonella immobilis]|uniref:acylphosphatase n=1 Tax=Dokdonella immobilis TaxID=578942 RepID=A0A1I5B9U7_9GAMM|nr:acylphosphatase [Dokdonella immobilis]SFN71311.1 acylphosphatase [Dokdonella immobilis]